MPFCPGAYSMDTLTGLGVGFFAGAVYCSFEPRLTVPIDALPPRTPLTLVALRIGWSSSVKDWHS